MDSLDEPYSNLPAAAARFNRRALSKRMTHWVASRPPAAQWALVGLLSFLLLPLGALAIQCGTGMRQQMAIRAIERLGGHVVPTQGGPSWLRAMTGPRVMRVFDHATLVNLSDTRTTDSDLTLLSRLRSVERLNLSDTAVTSAGTAELECLTELKALDLSGTQIRDAGLDDLRGLTSLEYLYLDDTEVTDGGLSALRPLANLREVSVAGTRVSADAINRFLRDRPQLRVRR